MIFLAKGHCWLGQRNIDRDGNVVTETKARFESDPDGGCIAVGTLDDDSMEQTGDAEIFGDYDHWGFLNCVFQKLAPTRPGNMPDFREIFEKMYEEQHSAECAFRPYCDRVRCSDCVCWDWIESIEENENEM